MSIDEIVHTCSNEKVAQAAVASLGFAFASRVKTAADIHGVTIGAFTAKIVREFGDEAHAQERRAVDRAMHRSDQPILRGLQVILERARRAQFAGSWEMAKEQCSACRSRLQLRRRINDPRRVHGVGRRLQGLVPTFCSEPSPG